MIFSLEALRARHGDSLLLHYGTADRPRTLLVDGGPGTTYGDALRPRLAELRHARQAAGVLKPDDPLALDLIMVSHVDDDHIGGLLRLTSELLEDQDLDRPPWIRPRTLWHNAFDDLVGGDAAVAEVPQELPSDGADAAAVLLSVGQGRRLRSDAERLGWKLNVPFDGLVRAPDAGGRQVRLDDATSLLIISPRDEEIEGLREEWAEQMRKLRAREATAAEVAAYLDRSPFNLSSMVVLVRQGERRMLLTGDARGDRILRALEAAKALDPAGRVHVEVLKLPHHGSIRNVCADFFARITADHYVISADGKHGNPETETLDLIAAARDDDDFTIHLTYGEGAGDFAARLEAFLAARAAARRSFGVECRADPALSLSIDIGDRRIA